MPAATAAVVSGLLWRLSIFTLLWWILTEGRGDALLFGIPFIAAAALVSSVFNRTSASPNGHGRIALGALGRLIPFFLWHSLRGGIDVGIRAFKRPLPLTPDLVDYRLRLPAGPATVLMAGLVSLMPGTLAVICEGRLRVHVLDRRGHFRRDLVRLEQHVGAVFSLQLAESHQQTGRADASLPGGSPATHPNSRTESSQPSLQADLPRDGAQDDR